MSRRNLAIAVIVVFCFACLSPNIALGLGMPREYLLLDVQNVDSANPESSIISLKGPPTKELPCDVFIAGGGTGGVACANFCANHGLKVIISEETSWLGGQMTSQGVSALDENYLVETTGANLSYQQLRQAIRQHYLTSYAPTKVELEKPYFHPGNSWVTRLSYEPAVGVKLIDALLKPAVQSGNLQILHRHKVADLKVKNGRITQVLLANLEKKTLLKIKPKFVIDATELGDLLTLAKAPYSVGSESKKVTGEPHAPSLGNHENVQDFVYPFAVEFREGESHLIEKPARYDDFKQTGIFTFNGYKMFSTAAKELSDDRNYRLLPFWEYRRLIDRAAFEPGQFAFDLSMINWESNDLRGENIIDQTPQVMAERLAKAKLLSLGFLYWLQTEAPRDEGGVGYPELCLRLDTMGSNDGLSLFPYIREARRLLSQTIVKEQDIARKYNPLARAKLFDDTVGIGLYPIDIHGHQEVPGAGQDSAPFQIPASAFLQKRVHNLIPGCKNIGTTHVTNGAYRLHPIEWAIGEAAAALTIIAHEKKKKASDIPSKKKYLRKLQDLLIAQGAPLYWFDDIAPGSKYFQAVQFLAVSGAVKPAQETLSFNAEEPISVADACQSLTTIFNRPKGSLYRSLSKEAQKERNQQKENQQKTSAEELLPESGLTTAQLTFLTEKLHLIKASQGFTFIKANQKRTGTKNTSTAGTNTVSRGDFALFAYKAALSKKRLGKF